MASLVPPPQKNIEHYHGLFPPHAKDRDKIGPAKKNTDDRPAEGGEGKLIISMKYFLTWAALMARVYSLDLEKCPRCGGKMKVVSALTDPPSIRRSLKGVGFSAAVPATVPAKPSPQDEFVFDLQTDVSSLLGAQWQQAAILYQRLPAEKNWSLET